MLAAHSFVAPSLRSSCRSGVVRRYARLVKARPPPRYTERACKGELVVRNLRLRREACCVKAQIAVVTRDDLAALITYLAARVVRTSNGGAFSAVVFQSLVIE